MTCYYRPLVQNGTNRPIAAHAIAGGWCWFTHGERLERGRPGEIIPADEFPADVLAAITRSRAPVSGLQIDQPRLMGILNVTPDSFSDGGQFDLAARAIAHGLDIANGDADIIDIGGESTRPGAAFVPGETEIMRTVPVINGIRADSSVPISIDTRKATVAGAAIAAGASIINDVSALTYDAELADIASQSGVPVCLMHAQGDPKTMQDDPCYTDVLLDVYDHLSACISHAVSKGITRENIIVDPGIGFGKTVHHNLTLIGNISLFHALGCPILLGASRKHFIGEIAKQPEVSQRLPGSLSVALAGISQGVQISRVHDIAETRQALDLWMGITGMRQ